MSQYLTYISSVVQALFKHYYLGTTVPVDISRHEKRVLVAAFQFMIEILVHGTSGRHLLTAYKRELDISAAVTAYLHIFGHTDISETVTVKIKLIRSKLVKVHSKNVAGCPQTIFYGEVIAQYTIVLTCFIHI